MHDTICTLNLIPLNCYRSLSFCRTLFVCTESRITRLYLTDVPVPGTSTVKRSLEKIPKTFDSLPVVPCTLNLISLICYRSVLFCRKLFVCMESIIIYRIYRSILLYVLLVSRP